MRLATPQKILEAALVVFAKNPLATLDQVAATAGMGRATLFRHFPGKKTLMRELALEAHRRCMAALEPLARSEGPALHRLEQAVEALIPLGAAFHFLTWEPWHTEDAELEANRKQYLALWSELLEAVRHTGAISSELPPVWVVATLDSLLYGAWEGIHNGDIAPRQAAALTLRTFLRGVGQDTPSTLKCSKK